MAGQTDGALGVELAGVRLRNPVILAAGTCGYLDEMAEVLDLSRIGAVVTKSITARVREGNPTWRIVETRAGMLNAIGLANVGVEHFVEHVAPRAAAVPTVVIASVAGFSVEEYVRVCAAMGEVGAIRGVELNVSCPNVHGGCEFGAEPRLLGELVSAVRGVLGGKALWVKLSPIAVGLPGMVEVARAAIEPRGAGAGGVTGGPGDRPGADVLCIANTVPAMGIDVESRRPRLANVSGGLSGPAVHPVAVKLVRDVYLGAAKQTGTPIVGIGGVMGWEDAAEFILAGASAVQMGTALFADPRSPLRVVEGLGRWVKRQGCAGVGELVGEVRLE